MVHCCHWPPRVHGTRKSVYMMYKSVYAHSSSNENVQHDCLRQQDEHVIVMLMYIHAAPVGSGYACPSIACSATTAAMYRTPTDAWMTAYDQTIFPVRLTNAALKGL
eukprot:GHRQ01016029.1.p2 GENE.GHRQ01016029.1~~GHRQ01016029.1.p2  ORF type:complete len:107 (-),score=9.80 GHRQ01016029.1:299-619(-)